MTKPLEANKFANAKGMALKDHKLSVARIQDELDALIKIFSHMRESFENEMMEGLGFKQLAVTDKQLKQAEQLSKIMTAVVASKIRYEKAAKALAESMTPEEERKACLDYVKSLDPKDRRNWVECLRGWMKQNNEAYVATHVGLQGEYQSELPKPTE